MQNTEKGAIVPSNEQLHRMQAAVVDCPTIGRVTLAKTAQVSQPMAQRFLAKHKQPKQAKPVAYADGARHELENKRLKIELREQKELIAKLSLSSALLDSIASSQLSPPEWMTRNTGAKTYRAIPTAVLADCHFDEVVKSSELGGVNAYNRQIAQLRLREFFTNTVRLGKEFFNGIAFEGLTLAMVGDIVSGNIHDELLQTNEAEILDTCLFWSEEIAAGIEYLAKFYGKLFIPCVVGNHGRLTKKPKCKGSVRDNFDWLIYKLVAKHFKGNDGIVFMIPDTFDCHYQIYKTRYCLTHGDQFKGGSGIAGALSPLLLGDARKRKRSNATNKSYDYMVMGHFHQEIDTMGIICCNTLKGYDEYANKNNFGYSEPSQAFWLTDSEKGRTLRAPIHVTSNAENWQITNEQAQPAWLDK